MGLEDNDLGYLREDIVDSESKCEMGWEMNDLGHLRGKYG